MWGANISTSTVFDDLAAPVVDKAMDGFNGTIFAYGQTAAGKTFSMFGNEQNPGITTRAVHAVFEKVRGLQSPYHSGEPRGEARDFPHENPKTSV